jgi:hypothetical protein
MSRHLSAPANAAGPSPAERAGQVSKERTSTAAMRYGAGRLARPRRLRTGSDYWLMPFTSTMTLRISVVPTFSKECGVRGGSHNTEPTGS